MSSDVKYMNQIQMRWLILPDGLTDQEGVDVDDGRINRTDL